MLLPLSQNFAPMHPGIMLAVQTAAEVHSTDKFLSFNNTLQTKNKTKKGKTLNNITVLSYDLILAKILKKNK